jgi:predicted DNA-binding ArsR family transcriptional regulator
MPNRDEITLGTRAPSGLTSDEVELISLFRLLSEDVKKYLLDMLRSGDDPKRRVQRTFWGGRNKF